MYLIDERRWLYIRTPKTGSTGITEALREVARTKRTGRDQHAKARDIDPKLFEGRWSFGFVRHPESWVISAFNADRNISPGFFAAENVTLRDFVETLYATPLEWLSDAGGRLLVDRVFTFERISEAYAELDLRERVENVRPYPPVEIGAVDRDAIRRRFVRDFAFYETEAVAA